MVNKIKKKTLDYSPSIDSLCNLYSKKNLTND